MAIASFACGDDDNTPSPSVGVAQVRDAGAHALDASRAPEPPNVPKVADADTATSKRSFPSATATLTAVVTNDLQPAPGGYCTQPCALDVECGAGAQCVAHGSSGGHCFASCSKDKACREGYECFAHSRDNDDSAAVCVAPGP